MAESTDWGAEAQKAAERHMTAVWEAFSDEQEGGEPQWPEGLTAPFDGCSTCEIRETLSAAMPCLRMMVYQEILDGEIGTQTEAHIRRLMKDNAPK